jgi:hypothetical protein
MRSNELTLTTLPKSEACAGAIQPAMSSYHHRAIYIADHFKGFGPKQFRNLFHALGLSRCEISIDSRIVRWLNEFGFPIRLSEGALSDRNYYSFVSNGVQQLSAQRGLYPCMRDAAIFASFDRGGWTEGNVVW